MSLPWLALYNVHKQLGAVYGFAAWIACWMTFEYVHLNWDLSWPWLTLGNVFASRPSWIQWYQYTGTSGGTCWILFTNVLLFKTLIPRISSGKNGSPKLIGATAALVGLPLLLSFLIKYQDIRKDKASVQGTSPNILVVQPNVDPYMKFSAGTQDVQLSNLLRLTASAIDSNTALAVWPETAINLPNGIEEDSIRNNYLLSPLWDFLKTHPRLQIYSGIEAYRIYEDGSQSKFSRKIPGTSLWYDAFNTAALLDSSGIRSRYHKSKLVPGVELLPPFLNFLGPLLDQFGGTTGGYAKQDERTVLTDSIHGYKIAPAICYESIYGDFLTGFMRNGANVIGIITNDGWWGNTSGHRQHLLYARLRAIENRRWVVRSANTGISAFIDPFGNIIDPQPWNTAAVIKMEIPIRNELTFFSRYGDLISKLMVILAILLVGYATIAHFLKKDKKIRSL